MFIKGKRLLTADKIFRGFKEHAQILIRNLTVSGWVWLVESMSCLQCNVLKIKLLPNFTKSCCKVVKPSHNLFIFHT